ncbi:MAG: hypothetical protein C0520_10290 [Sphingopyxis sp.]|nr:hypothetical protein [Sphingopyxis sp.]
MEAGGLKTATIVDRIEGASEWTIERDVHVLILHEAGSYHWLETWLDGRRTSLGDPLPGELWLVPAGTAYRASAKGGTARYIEVEIPVERLPIAPDAPVLAGHFDRVVALLVRAMASGEANTAEVLLATLAETLATGTPRRISPTMGERIDNLMLFIQDQMEGPLTVEELAAEAGMSVNSLIAHFARSTGRTPAQYVLHQRLRRAGWFLIHRPLSVAEIAFATGFSSHAHLCVAFRRKLGMSPGEWRRRHASAIVEPGEG